MLFLFAIILQLYSENTIRECSCKSTVIFLSSNPFYMWLSERVCMGCKDSVATVQALYDEGMNKGNSSVV